jgi:hypothetical protein
MITPAIVAEVERLLCEADLTYREIAERTGISHGSVSLIARGKRPSRLLSGGGDDDLSEACGPKARCPSCGAMVYSPCRLCRLRAVLERTPRTSPARGIQEEEPLELRLKQRHRQRYEEIRARREAMDPTHPTAPRSEERESQSPAPDQPSVGARRGPG